MRRPSRHQIRSNAAKATVQLPKLRLQEFSGEPGTWEQFWQVFDFAVNSNRDLPDQLKLSYLLGQLVKGSPAQMAVSGYDCSGENYPLVLATLRERFGDKRRQADLLLDQMLELPPVPDNSHFLRAFVDLVDQNCRQLERSDILQDGRTLIRALKPKLPPSILSELCKIERRSGSNWDIAMWRRELSELVTEREEVERVTQRLPGKPKPSVKPKRDFPAQHRVKNPTVENRVAQEAESESSSNSPTPSTDGKQ